MSAVDMVAMIGARAVQMSRRRPMGGRRGQVFMSGTKTARRGVYSASRSEYGPWGLGSSAGGVGAPVMTCPWAIGANKFPCPKRKSLNLQVLNPVEQWCSPSPLIEAARNTCNTYSVPYKGKDLKKRLSPKSLNTLIHQCITFYKTLIFQYFSLWKSVFSCN